MSELQQVSAMGSGSFAAGESAMGHGSFVGAGETSPSTPADPCRARPGTRIRRAVEPGRGARGQTMSFDVVDLVARQHDIPHWLAQGIAADVGLSEALRAERRHFPRLERRRNETAILAHLIEREEREQ